MEWIDIALLAVIAIIAGLAGWYVYRSKKKGNKCIGCPDGGSCDSCGHNCGQRR